MRRTVLAGTVVVVAFGLASCSGGDDDSSTATSAPRATTDDASTTTTDAAPETTDDPDAVIASPASSVAEDDAAQDGDLDNEGADSESPPIDTMPLVEGLAPAIELVSPQSGAGIRPLLEWSAVDGAAYYLATVYAPDGSPYWTWTGTTTSVHVGGEPVLDDDRPGPSVTVGMTWGVVALDDTIVPIALSDRRPIGP